MFTRRGWLGIIFEALGATETSVMKLFTVCIVSFVMSLLGLRVCGYAGMRMFHRDTCNYCFTYQIEFKQNEAKRTNPPETVDSASNNTPQYLKRLPAVAACLGYLLGEESERYIVDHLSAVWLQDPYQLLRGVGSERDYSGRLASVLHNLSSEIVLYCVGISG